MVSSVSSSLERSVVNNCVATARQQFRDTPTRAGFIQVGLNISYADEQHAVDATKVEIGDSD